MNGLAYLIGLMILVGFIWNVNYQDAMRDKERTASIVLSGQLRAYGFYVGKYAAANAGANSEVSDAQAALPSWLVKPTGARGWAHGGKGIVFMTPPTLAQAFEAVRACKPAQICGVTRSGVLYRPGQAAPVSATLPSVVPVNGAFVYVR